MAGPPRADDAAAAGAALAVVLVAPSGYAKLRRTVRHLRAQTARDRVELVVVVSSSGDVRIDEEDAAAFARVRVVESGPARSWVEATAAGVRGASAPLVALCEDHVYPDPGWVAAVIAAHRGAWGAVGPVIGNANPATAVSWANLLIAYGHWLEPAAPGRAGGVVDDLPTHNTTYKRALLLEYGDRLGAMLRREGPLHADLRARGHLLYLDPGAIVYHDTVSLVAPALLLRFHAGRLAAAARARRLGWSAPTRLAHAAAFPVIPLRRLLGVVRRVRRAGRAGELFPRVLPALAGLLVTSAVGEAVGYALGPGDSLAQISELELHRERQLAAVDREAVAC